MQSKLLYDKYRGQLINLHGLSVMVITIAELVAYFILLYHGLCRPGISSNYLWCKVIIPIVLNVSGYILERIINNTTTFQYERKNSTVIYISLISAIVVSFVHMDMIVALASFVFPIFLSGMFKDKKRLDRSFVISLLFLGMNILFRNIKYTSTVDDVINYIALFGIVVIAYLFGYISIDFNELQFTIIENQAQTNARLRKKTQIDLMTGLYNRETMFQELGRALELYKNYNIGFCFAMIDIDDFKQINDTYGHRSGDIVLMKLAGILRKQCDEVDGICRYGGDEFAIVFYYKTEEKVKSIIEKIKYEFSNQKYDFTDEKITCSCGMVSCDGAMSREELFNKADMYMYRAKNRGKNQVYSKEV
ncbi:MAG: GGDEF domain-containing protein [Clostridia bacterium]|nr:GGDEF domain-containing protein [Clostridia bacterium]